MTLTTKSRHVDGNPRRLSYTGIYGEFTYNSSDIDERRRRGKDVYIKIERVVIDSALSRV